MEEKKYDKYKKKYILKQIEGQWGYYEFDGDIVLIKNCILKEKYNKIYQVIFHGGYAIDGLYLINSFDINVHYESTDNKTITITNKKYDKIAGYDDCTIHSFENKDKFITWLIEEGFLEESDLNLINAKTITKDMIKDMQKFILDC